ncbi:MAG: methyl-accepting chemotaxis protein [Treponema sp.]|nr:methyl-accepting chemotaxis protein [Treponema sp.]
MKDLKLTVRLIISVAAFLLPLGILLFSVISISVASIQKENTELKGIETLRPALSLMHSIPQYVRISVDNAPGDLAFTKQYISELFLELDNKYTSNFGSKPVLVSMKNLHDNWEYLVNAVRRDAILWSYRELMNDLFRLTAYIGDISGLITDGELESAYLISASVYEMPQAQDKIVVIDNLLRTIIDGAFTQRRKSELLLQLDLLLYSDNARIQKRFDIINTHGFKNDSNFESFEYLLKGCIERIAYFHRAVEQVLASEEIDHQVVSVLYEASGHTNNAVFRLQSASLDRLETVISSRIRSHWFRFIASLGAALLATFLAFGMIISTGNYIRKSTGLMGKVFKRLDENDLTVTIEAISRDEMGDLITALGVFLKKLNTTFISFNSNTDMVTTAAVELSSSAQEVTATANEQSASIAEIVNTMENNKDLSSKAAEKTVEVAQLAVQTQELSKRGADLRDANEDMMLDILQQNAKIIEIIKNLADMLSRIDESIQLIDTIADRTKLIAFNAALEASSSGEAGSRFSVVASEIRRFADNVVESVIEIKEKISEVQEASGILITEANNGSNAIETGYNRMVEQKEVFENIVDVSQNVADRSQQISNLSKQQELASVQVFQALKEISIGIKQFVASSSKTLSTVEKLSGMSSELKEKLSEYQTRVQE